MTAINIPFPEIHRNDSNSHPTVLFFFSPVVRLSLSSSRGSPMPRKRQLLSLVIVFAVKGQNSYILNCKYINFLLTKTKFCSQTHPFYFHTNCRESSKRKTSFMPCSLNCHHDTRYVLHTICLFRENM
jgi:hypothetical protein